MTSDGLGLRSVGLPSGFWSAFGASVVLLNALAGCNNQRIGLKPSDGFLPNPLVAVEAPALAPTATASAEGAAASAAPTAAAIVPATEVPDANSARPTVAPVKWVLLHHSVGRIIYDGGVESWFEAYNQRSATNYQPNRLLYPADPWPWQNYPQDYFALWVEHAGPAPYQGQATLDVLASQFDVVVLKHGLAVSQVEKDEATPDPPSDRARRTVENYQAQYGLLRQKMQSFPQTQFVVWTPPALTEGITNPSSAFRIQQFSIWLKDIWDLPNDNIYIWDFRRLETVSEAAWSDGAVPDGLYLLPGNAVGAEDSNPNQEFSRRVAPLFCQRVVDVIEGRGDATMRIGY